MMPSYGGVLSAPLLWKTGSSRDSPILVWSGMDYYLELLHPANLFRAFHRQAQEILVKAIVKSQSRLSLTSGKVLNLCFGFFNCRLAVRTTGVITARDMFSTECT